jgi:hypothetical protein
MTALGFLLLLSAPHLAEIFDTETSIAAIEKRATAPRPDIRLIPGSWPEYARRFEKYYNDSFGLRHHLIRWNNRLRLFTFHESPVKGVRVGREGWLFYADEWALEEYENVMPLKASDLENIRNRMEERRAWLEQRGIRLFVLAVPEKHTIYSEYLPESIHRTGRESRLDQVADVLSNHPGITFVDTRQALLKAKSTERLYHRTDSHWNDHGAFIAYRELLKHISPHFPSVGIPAIRHYEVSMAKGEGGDLAGMLSLSDLIHEERITLRPEFNRRSRDGKRPYSDPVDQAVYPGREMVVKETGDSSLPRVLVFRDSFSEALIPFMAESFRSSVFVWTFDFLPELIESEKPDIVIIECVERYLGALMRENPPRVKAAAQPPA